jgi:hypothetical protein
LVEHDAELEVAVFGVPGIDEVFGGGDGDGKGLFDEDVEVFGEGVEGDGDVGEVGAGDDDGVAGFGIEEVGAGGEGGDGGEFFVEAASLASLMVQTAASEALGIWPAAR